MFVPCSFTAVARLGDEEISCETGASKHEARIRAAERALQNLNIKVKHSARSSKSVV